MPVMREVLLVGGDYQARDKLQIKLADMGFTIVNHWIADTHTKARDVKDLPKDTELVIALPYYGNPELITKSKELSKAAKVPWVTGHPVDWLQLKSRIDALPTLNRALTHKLPLPKPVELDPTADRVWFCDACSAVAELADLTGTEICEATDDSRHAWRAVPRKDTEKIAQAAVPAPKPPPPPTPAPAAPALVKPVIMAKAAPVPPTPPAAPPTSLWATAVEFANTAAKAPVDISKPYTQPKPSYEVAPPQPPPENPLVLPVALTKPPPVRPSPIPEVPIRTMANGAKSPGPVRNMGDSVKKARGQFLLDWLEKNPHATTFNGAYEQFKKEFGHGVAERGLHWYLEAIFEKRIPMGANLMAVARKYMHDRQPVTPAIATPPVVSEVVTVAPSPTSSAPKFVPPAASPNEDKVPDDVVAAVKLLTEALKGKRQICGYIAFNFDNGEVSVSNEIEILVRKTIKAQL